VSAQDALAAFARDLVEEIAAGRALELAASMDTTTGSGGRGQQQPLPRSVFPRGAAAVHPHLGQHLVRMPGDTISCHAYKHLGGVQGPPPFQQF
jgi:hypothetical protein